MMTRRNIALPRAMPAGQRIDSASGRSRTTCRRCRGERPGRARLGIASPCANGGHARHHGRPPGKDLDELLPDAVHVAIVLSPFAALPAVGWLASRRGGPAHLPALIPAALTGYFAYAFWLVSLQRPVHRHGAVGSRARPVAVVPFRRTERAVRDADHRRRHADRRLRAGSTSRRTRTPADSTSRCSPSWGRCWGWSSATTSSRSSCSGS